ncbi:MAG: DUF4177 domain-containing protein [Flavobacteriaceae bacterium]|nr:DUF4177 domain-containing protein [Flavobacteriaceae bacterium]
MKEYKVVAPSLGFRNTVKKLEDVLNNHAREGWVVKEISIVNRHLIIFERDKNR